MNVKDTNNTSDIPRASEVQRGNERILFVDDEIYLAEVGREMLEDYGYIVESMTSSKQALEMFEQDPDLFDLVITDYTMPEMTGEKLAREIRRINPEIPIIMCTGIILEPETIKDMAFDKILIKPIDMDDMITTVRQVIDCAYS
jgi:CheY-like chemotaxis protein